VNTHPPMYRSAAALLMAMAVAALPATLQAQATRRTVARVASGSVDAASAVSRGSDTLPTLRIDREVFSYRGAGRRDPYQSLMRSESLRPLVSDLRLTAVAFDPVGTGSVAILRDVVSRQQYRVRVGQTLGRLRVAGIRQKAVIFSIDEFGFSRQETLPLTGDSTSTRAR
jgi:hypothetical protein